MKSYYIIICLKRSRWLCVIDFRIESTFTTFYHIWSCIHFIVFSSMILLLQDQQTEPNDDVAGTEAGMFCSIINKPERFKTRV